MAVCALICTSACPRSARRADRAAPPGVAAVYGAEVFTISDRPAEAADRAVPGHWEGDLILGAGHQSAIGTLVERSTRFTILLHLPIDHTAETVAAAMIEAIGELPDHLRRSITWDRGSEMAHWRDIQLQLKPPVFFCNPHSPWRRGTNENTNRLLRFWFEKGSDLSGTPKPTSNASPTNSTPAMGMRSATRRLAGRDQTVPYRRQSPRPVCRHW